MTEPNAGTGDVHAESVTINTGNEAPSGGGGADAPQTSDAATTGGPDTARAVVVDTAAQHEVKPVAE